MDDGFQTKPDGNRATTLRWAWCHERLASDPNVQEGSSVGKAMVLSGVEGLKKQQGGTLPGHCVPADRWGNCAALIRLCGNQEHDRKAPAALGNIERLKLTVFDRQQIAGN